MKRLTLAFLVLLAPLAHGQVPQPSGPSFDAAALDAYAQKSLADWQVPGVALAVVKDDKVLLAKGYGTREAGKPEQRCVIEYTVPQADGKTVSSPSGLPLSRT